ncbi:XrtA/PEP-CTERM system-associated ATPase [Vibrio salinus]|uniref:XrtA/PEP-CTERM system-associated ATPase n=1 Tax=Vibrio salinus TaxID=2899784 RepID=UPI001E3189CC|nr:XrtA/PEP-CTERM system-associated ATPase [Vibrio salinus]MCE0493255.1 XrtA-associated ATPase [Vibrio salinus]
MYESFFGFSDKPFKLSPDPHFFYGSAHHNKAISYLRYGLELGEGFIVITGPIGTGKTTIARSLISSLDESIVAIQIATTRLTPEALVSLIAANFGLQVEGLGKADVLRRLEAFLNNLHRQGKRALLVLDEAQNLSSETIEELRMLSNFQIDDKPLIQSFLLGQEELKPIIELPEMEQFRQRIIASCHLKPFDNEETKNYIQHRLKLVGWSDNPQLNSEAFELIADYTKGVPRKINIFMDRLFLFAFLENITFISTEHIESVKTEMGDELSGGLQNASKYKMRNLNGADTDTGVKVTHNDLHDIEKVYKTLAEVTKVLDDVLYRKTLTIKHLDKMIREKRKILSETEDDKSFQKLAGKRWLKELIKDRDNEL